MQEHQGCELCRPFNKGWTDLHVCDLPSSSVLLSKDQRFRGWTIVVANEHVDDLFELPSAKRHALDADVACVAAALRAVVRPDRMNYAIFGNVTPHLHWNLIPRTLDDGRWGSAPWPHEPRPGAPGEIAALRAALRGLLRRA
jgi:diadenosine tetraphosphate (Ap4A) HIT family hydrolase